MMVVYILVVNRPIDSDCDFLFVHFDDYWRSNGRTGQLLLANDLLLSFISPKRQPVHIHIQSQKYKKHTKLKNIQKLLKQYKTTFLNHKNTYEMKIKYKR